MDFPQKEPGIDAFGGSGPSIPPGGRTSSATQKDQAEKITQSPAAKTNASGPYIYPIHNADRFEGKITFMPIEVNIPKFAITGEAWRNFFGSDDEKLKESESTASGAGDEAAAQSAVLRRQNANGAGDGAAAQNAAARRQNANGAGDGAAAQNAAARNSPATEPTSTSTKNLVTYTPLLDQKIILNMPIAYVVNDMIGYENAELGAGGAAALNAMERTGEMGSALSAALGSFTGSFTDLFKQGMGADAARVALARGIAKAPISAGLKAAGSIAARVTVNPNVRAIFRGVSLREFSFQFKFIPYSAEESRAIADIIRTFRTHAYPEAIYAGPVAVGYKYPDLFKIKVQYKGKDVGSKIKMCYLRNVQTSYNPTAASFHADGNPTEIDLSLSFTEHTTISREDIVSGGNGTTTSNVEFDQGVGY
jgi:hypothetical protein